MPTFLISRMLEVRNFKISSRHCLFICKTLLYTCINDKDILIFNMFVILIPIKIYSNFLMLPNNQTIFRCSDSLKDYFYSLFICLFSFFKIRFHKRSVYHVWLFCPLSLFSSLRAAHPHLFFPLQLVFWRK